jgi:hypothetical protein
MRTKVGPDDLERFFAEKLDNDMRQQLLNMPADEMQTRLERLYFATDMGSGEAAPWWDEWPGGDEERGGLRGDRHPGPPPRDIMDRERMPLEPGGPHRPGGPRDDGRRDGRPPRFDRPGGPPPERPPPGPPPENI